MGSPENSSLSIEEKQEQYMLTTYPKLRAMKDRFPTEFLDRSRIYKSLQDIKKRIESEKGIFAINSNKDQLIKEVDALISFIECGSKSDFQKNVWSDFLGWHEGKADFNDQKNANTMTRRELLTRFLPKESRKIEQWLDGTKQEEVQGGIENLKIDNINIVLDALSERASSHLNQQIAKFQSGKKTNDDIKDLQSVINKEFKNATHLQINSLTDKEYVANALRLLGDTEQAASLLVEHAKDRRKDQKFTAYENISKYIEARKEAFKTEAAKKADIRLEQILQSLVGTPEHVLYETAEQKDNIRKGFIELYTEQKSVEEYIKKYGSEGLPSEYTSLDEMKGLNGILNFSDENVKLTKEIAIMVAATLATAGASALLSGVATGARIAAGGARALQAEKAARGANVVSRGVTATRGGYNTIKAATAETLAKGVVGRALVFTGTDTILRSTVLSSEGQKNPTMESFAQRFAVNTMMFGAFSGIEKIAGPISTKLFGDTLVFKNGINLGKGIILTAGDLTAIYALHAIEKQKLTLSIDELASMIAITIAFRAGIPAMSYTGEKISAMTGELKRLVGESKAVTIVANQLTKIGTPLSTATQKVKEVFASKVENTSFVPKNLRNTFTDDQYRVYIERMEKMGNPERLSVASGLLQRTLTPKEQDAIIAAHNIGSSGVHNWSIGDLRAKTKELEKGGFSTPEIRILMEHGITGKNTLNQETIRRFLQNNLSKPGSIGLERLGLAGWKLEKLATRKGEGNQYKLSIPGKDDMIFQGSDQLKKYIAREMKLFANGSGVHQKAMPTMDTVATSSTLGVTTTTSPLRLEYKPLIEAKQSQAIAQAKVGGEISEASNATQIRDSLRFLKGTEEELLGHLAAYKNVASRLPKEQQASWTASHIEPLERLIQQARDMKPLISAIPPAGTIPMETRLRFDQFSKALDQHRQQFAHPEMQAKNTTGVVSDTSATPMAHVEQKPSAPTATATKSGEKPKIPESNKTSSLQDEIRLTQERLAQAKGSYEDSARKLNDLTSQAKHLGDEIKELEKRYDDLRINIQNTSGVASPQLTRDFHNLSDKITEKRVELQKIQDEITTINNSRDRANLESQISGHAERLQDLTIRKQAAEYLEGKAQQTQRELDELSARYNDKFTHVNTIRTGGQEPSEAMLYDLKNLRGQIDGKSGELQKTRQQIDDIMTEKTPIFKPAQGDGFAPAPYLNHSARPQSNPKDTNSATATGPSKPKITSVKPVDALNPGFPKAPYTKNIPENTSVLPASANTPEAKRNWAKNAWIPGTILLIGGALLACTGDKDNQTLTRIDPTTNTLIGPAMTIEEACKKSEMEFSNFNYERKIKGNNASETYRQGVSERFQKTPEYREFLQFLEQHKTQLLSRGDCMNATAYLTIPTPKSIQALQQHIGMPASDDKNGQDGILGTNTIKALKRYLENELAKQ